MIVRFMKPPPKGAAVVTADEVEKRRKGRKRA